jgi:large subunit ribosomal protein L21
MSESNSSYAVVKTSGRQYRVSPGDTISVEKVAGAPGSTIEIKEVLMVGGAETLLGTPFVKGATVTCVVEQQYRGTKVLVFKKKRRHKYRNMRGHRSELTRLFVSAIATPSGVVNAESKPHVLDPNRVKKVVQKAKPQDGELSTAAPKAAKKKSTAGKAKKSTKKPAKKKAGSAKSKK